jgi:hypothetical protein
MPTPTPAPKLSVPPPRIRHGPSPKIHETRDTLGIVSTSGVVQGKKIMDTAIPVKSRMRFLKGLINDASALVYVSVARIRKPVTIPGSMAMTVSA